MKENLNDANPANNFCAPHTLINAGKQAPVVANHAEDFGKKLKKVIQYPGKARDLARDVFDGTIMNDCGVKIFLKYEKCCQIYNQDPKKPWRKFTRVQQKKGQKSRQRSCYRNMAPKKIS